MGPEQGNDLPQNSVSIDLGSVQSGSWVYVEVQNGSKPEEEANVGLGIDFRTSSSHPLKTLRECLNS